MHTSFGGIFHSIHCYTESCVLIFYEQQHRNMQFGFEIFPKCVLPTAKQQRNERRKNTCPIRIQCIWGDWILNYLYLCGTQIAAGKISLRWVWVEKEYVYSNSSMWPIDDEVYQWCCSLFCFVVVLCCCCLYLVAFNLFLNNSQIYMYTHIAHTHTLTPCDFRLEIGIPQTIFIWPLKNELLILTQHFICILF